MTRKNKYYVFSSWGLNKHERTLFLIIAPVNIFDGRILIGIRNVSLRASRTRWNSLHRATICSFPSNCWIISFAITFEEINEWTSSNHLSGSITVALKQTRLLQLVWVHKYCYVQSQAEVHAALWYGVQLMKFMLRRPSARRRRPIRTDYNSQTRPTSMDMILPITVVLSL